MFDRMDLHDRYPAGVQNGKNDEYSPPNLVDRRWGHFYHGKYTPKIPNKPPEDGVYTGPLTSS